MMRLANAALIGALASAAFAVAPLSATADDAVTREEFNELRKGQEAILKELAEIKKLLAARPAPPAPQAAVEKLAGTVALGSVTPKGDAAAPLTLIEFSDYQCPYCKRHADQTVPQLIKDYVDSGKMRYAFRDFPLEAIHPQAAKAAEAARCAGDQSKYWEMHDRLFANQHALNSEQLLQHAQALTLDENAFKACMDQGKHAAAIRKDLEDGTRLGVRGTPTLVLGVSDGDKVKNAVVIRGAQPIAIFKAEIDRLLAAPAAATN